MSAAADDDRGASRRRRRAKSSRQETIAQLLHSPTFLISVAVIAFWTLCAFLGYHIAPHDPTFQDQRCPPLPRRVDHPFGTDQLGRDVLSRVIAGSRSTMEIAPAATLLATVARQRDRPHARLLRRLVRRHRQPPHRRLPGDPRDHLPDRGDHEPRHVGADPDHHDRPGLHADHRAHGARGRARRGGPGLRAGGQAARRARALHPLRRDPAEHVPPILVEATVRLGYAIFTLAGITFLGLGLQPPTPDWSVDITAGFSTSTTPSTTATTGRCSSPASRSPRSALRSRCSPTACSRCSTDERRTDHGQRGPAARRRRRRSRSRTSRSTTACAGSGARCCAASASASSAARRTASWASPAAASRPPR